MSGKFFNERMCLENRKWRKAIERKQELYIRPNDIRTEFGRDYTRILHSPAYRRLKHKTQVFFATQNDHICNCVYRNGEPWKMTDTEVQAKRIVDYMTGKRQGTGGPA